MPNLRLAAIAGLVLASALAACGEREPKPDAAVIDQHLNNMMAQEEAEQRRLVEEARQREDLREREMEQREANFSDGNAAADAANNSAAASE